jgi:hydroxymethylpyrimidine/phosphomethylpyrimidine kinase
VTAVHVPPVDFLRAQIDACFDDFRISTVKLGMLANKQLIDAVADALERHRPAFIVLDPVMVATSGARLLEPDALDALGLPNYRMSAPAMKLRPAPMSTIALTANQCCRARPIR